MSTSPDPFVRSIPEQISDLEEEVVDLASFLECAVRHHQHDELVLESAKRLLRRVQRLREIRAE